MKQISEIPCIVTMFLYAGSAWAIARMEPPRVGETVKYDDGSEVGVSCEVNASCRLHVTIGGKTIDLTESFGKSLDTKRIIPNNVSLLKDSGITDRFTVQFEVACNEYAKLPPAFLCMASACFEDSRLEDVHEYKRFFSDKP